MYIYRLLTGKLKLPIRWRELPVGRTFNLVKYCALQSGGTLAVVF